MEIAEINIVKLKNYISKVKSNILSLKYQLKLEDNDNKYGNLEKELRIWEKDLIKSNLLLKEEIEKDKKVKLNYYKYIKIIKNDISNLSKINSSITIKNNINELVIILNKIEKYLNS